MLVLSRKCGQTIVLPEWGVRFTILKMQGDRVRVGITAPSGVSVHREEVWQCIEASGVQESIEKVRCQE
jgi:carbon storage regulator